MNINQKGGREDIVKGILYLKKPGVILSSFSSLPPPCMLGQTTTQREDRIGESKASVIAEGEWGTEPNNTTEKTVSSFVT